ncbi:hypothetical protein HR11_03870 [Porphyromonas macacae]|uniref:hypothetical protein n=1 Tax=Porphyromonas macacae TaxID=28115 RepID=UPI00052BD40A|nr:hypothetical protein [Porphyromonas macacae]KGN99412.1 hypothetical protein HR11_03870 [Porphyromonas macacae]
MAKLEGIIYKAFGNYVVLRGFAPIGDISEISKRPDAYQRNADEQHKVEIIEYLNDLNAYFPEVTLACRSHRYDELIESIGSDKEVGKDNQQYVKGLRVLSERLPIGRDRARHAYLELNNLEDAEKLTRVDGNHRLEPFTSELSWWYQFVDIPEDIKNETDKERKEGWIKYQAEQYRKEISEKIIPFTVIISDAKNANNFEAKIFHDVNFRQLPLREEASLRIISDLKAFDDKEKLGKAYPLALELIAVAKNNTFDSIHWLKNNNDIDKDYYRTACLRVIQLLLNRKTAIKEDLEEEKNKLSEKEKEVAKNKTELEKLRKQAQSSPKKALQQQEEQKHKIQRLENEARNLDFQQKHIERRVKRLSDYLEKINDISEIKKAITSLGHVYESFEGKEYGNIAFLSAMVYYSLLDKTQLQAFIHWAVRNGINKVNEPDDLSKDSAENLIKMFEQIFQSKKNEVFVSMQFGDSQSELIYEKIVRAIEQFNTKYTGIHLNVYPIRIDRTVESSTYSIQDRILEAIKSCSLIIADLSSKNINVYHEIGYAMGVAQANNLLPNMILLYKEDTEYNGGKQDVDKFVGFNLRNLSQLRFKDYKQLVDGLVERLEKHYEV